MAVKVHFVSVVRLASDRTNGGVSARHDHLQVVAACERQSDKLTSPVMVLRQFAPGQACLSPLQDGPDGHIGPMAGGNYAVGDEDFQRAVAVLLGHHFRGAVAIHDRYESQELHDTLAR